MARVVGKSALWKSLIPREQVYCHRFKCFCCIHRRFVIHVASFHTLVSLLLFFTNFKHPKVAPRPGSPKEAWSQDWWCFRPFMAFLYFYRDLTVSNIRSLFR
jgi:hypothetical protein